ncbi:MAG: hypothetical protein CVV25_05645 [Ignavibacteriae bacterium HGW-Ignavibacteriae-4]|jgi:formylglycine-generating enzyme required for sulfatase activity|nr:MAG: hypothetical protein CVV25_05645 [Ignavibacteriae bacterium HGW-Ignavibacteriae-4]
MIRLTYILISFILLAGSSVIMAEPQSKIEWISIPSGKFYPFFADTIKPIEIDGFFISSTQITNAQFLRFVKTNPKWRRSKIKAIFAESNYLGYWESDTVLGKDAPPNAPVVMVSWFAANAYSKWVGGRLADMSEWEYVASASTTKLNAYNDNSFSTILLRMYEKLPKIPLPNVGEKFKNAYAVYDMHGLVWEWTRDFNSVIVSTDSREKTNQDGKLFCAAGSIGNVDPSNYSAFVRYSMWSSLQAKFCLRNLGFRCVKDK